MPDCIVFQLARQGNFSLHIVPASRSIHSRFSGASIPSSPFPSGKKERSS
jgi:hypothetical protein